MIDKIELKSVASYNEIGSSLDALKKVNILYGSNGSGKTTISRLIDNPDNAKFKECSIHWNDDKLDTFVYNQDFIEKNFNQDNEQLKGIFTLGEATKEKLDAIKQYKEDIETLKSDIKKRTNMRDGVEDDVGKAKELENLENEFSNTCWKLKQKHDTHFIEIFAEAKVRGDRKNFKAKIIHESENNNSDLFEIEELQKKCETIFSSDGTKCDLINTFTYDDFEVLEDDQILSKKIIGKDDVDIAAMITRLSNSDWVKQGRAYFEQNNKHCPFCQQETKAQFSEDLEAYFDETYETEIRKLENVVQKYRASSSQLITALESIHSKEHKYLDRDAFETQKDLITAKANANITKLYDKQKEPSSVVTLDTLKNIVAKINALISDANEEAQKHNDMVDNHTNVKNELISQVWRFIVNEIYDQYIGYKKKKSDLEKAISGLTKSIEEKELEKAQKEQEHFSLQSQITGIEATITAINKILKSFGFTSFALAEAENNKGYYRIIRSDGRDARKSLSEGEKTFVTFLYFYHLLSGGNTEDKIASDRVVVIDDPVSSLDSDILFIVSNLIRRLIKSTATDAQHIKQLFIMTHNIYFHKQVSFMLAKKKICSDNEITYWIIRKFNGSSKAENYEKNPVRTSYQLLWDEIKEKKYSKHTVQNLLRRILENYFIMFGDYSYFEDLTDKFEGEDKITYMSLISWLHDGSHNIHDDISVCASDEQVHALLRVFREVFVKTNHISHYQMMMKEDEHADSANDNAKDRAA